MSRDAGVRAGAARVIAEVIGRGRSLDQALGPVQEALADRRDRAFLQAVCYGVLRFYPRLQALLDELLERPLRSREVQLKSLMLAGLYQISEMDVPDHAAVAESVAATEEIRRPRAKSLVNAVLRRYIRERDRIDRRVLERPEGRWAHPCWLVDRIAADWPHRWQAVLDANNQAPPMWLRVNRRRSDRDRYLAMLDAGAAGGAVAPESLLLEKPRPVESLPGFAEGIVSVQDAGAQLAAPLLDARPGDRVLDACAAPGGKAAHLLEICPEIHLDALELEEDRLEVMRATFDRLGLHARTIKGDASHPDEWWNKEQYDRILVDTPCTASGVIRRHPDIKVLRRESDIEPLACRQSSILDGLWPLLRPGGRMVYATCSVFRMENALQVSSFVERTRGAIPASIGSDCGWGIEDGPGRQILPGDAGMDGFYYACLTKAT